MNERLLPILFLGVILLGFAGCQFKYQACLGEGFSPNYCAAFVMR